jgi:ankyrin repeat protein
MYSRTQTYQSTELSRSKDLLYYTALNDLASIKRLGLVTKSNVNVIIESNTKSPVLHYALAHSDGTIAKYLLELGADPHMTNSRGSNAFDISMDLHRRCVYEHEISKRDHTIAELGEETTQLKKKFKQETESKQFLQKSVDNYRAKVSDLETSNNILKLENTELKEQVGTLKRKVTRLNESIDGFLNSNKK